MAMVEAVLNPDDERYYSFSAKWSETEEIESMRNGSGDEFDVVFSEAGVYVRGFDHESTAVSPAAGSGDGAAGTEQLHPDDVPHLGRAHDHRTPLLPRHGQLAN
ncbi:hypothetical protein ACFZAR_36845 [Streptomyces sp. NPDC008222]|uniref:hypothetical protein n=1 Tax=Streptomyces sp. NPDC008222 TaxID=3364820 RepID=UPI0036E88FA4